jgi:hypothetical protein
VATTQITRPGSTVPFLPRASTPAAMANLFNVGFQDFLRALRQHEVRYLLVGGYSFILHGYSRTTGDLDVWVERSTDNHGQLEKAFRSFGMPVFYMTTQNFLRNAAMDVFTFGRHLPACPK